MEEHEFERQQKIPEFAYPRYLFKRTLVSSKDAGSQDRVSLLMKTLVFPKGGNRYVPVIAAYSYPFTGEQNVEKEMDVAYGFHTLCYKVFNNEKVEFEEDVSVPDLPKDIDFKINEDDDELTL